VINIKRGNVGMVLFTVLIVVIILSLIELLFPNRSSLVFILTAGLSALIGGLLGEKLFPRKK